MTTRTKPHLAHFTLFAAVSLFLSACDNPADQAQTADVGDPVAAADWQSGSGKELEITPATSRIGFIGSKVTGSHTGGFNKFSGIIKLSEDGKEVAGARVEIDMTSVFTDTEKLTGHLKSADFFDVEKFPTSTFTTTRIDKGAKAEKMPDATHTVTGNLTLHGVTRSIQFAAKIDVPGGKASVKSDFAINRKDFGIVYPGKPDDLIRDEVLLKIAVEAPAGT